MDAIVLLTKNFNFELCVELLDLYPEPTDLKEIDMHFQNLSDIVSIMIALFHEQSSNLTFFPDYTGLEEEDIHPTVM